jgi:hypothetical protein
MYILIIVIDYICKKIEGKTCYQINQYLLQAELVL